MSVHTTCNRRTVLKATGTALAATVVGTGTASAVCAYTTRDVHMYPPDEDGPCADLSYSILITEGTYGQAGNVCYGLQQFQCDRGTGWVAEDALGYC